MDNDYSRQKYTDFIAVPRDVADAYSTKRFSDREQRVLWLIIRMSFGCYQSDYAKLTLADFEIKGLHRSDACNALKSLESHNVIRWDRKSHIISLNRDTTSWIVDEYNANRLDTKRFSEVLAKNLAKRSHARKRNTNECVSESLTISQESQEELAEESSSKQTNKFYRNDKQSPLYADQEETNDECGDVRSIEDVLIDKVGFDMRQASKLTSKHDEGFLWSTYDAMCEQTKPVLNPVAWFMKALKEGWYPPQTKDVKEDVPTDDDDGDEEITNSKDIPF